MSFRIELATGVRGACSAVSRPQVYECLRPSTHTHTRTPQGTDQTLSVHKSERYTEALTVPVLEDSSATVRARPSGINALTIWGNEVRMVIPGNTCLPAPSLVVRST
jgi:hypothetical protein